MVIGINDGIKSIIQKIYLQATFSKVTKVEMCRNQDVLDILTISKIGDKTFILRRILTSYNPQESPTVQSDDKRGRLRTLIGHNRWPVDQLDSLFKTEISTCGSE